MEQGPDQLPSATGSYDRRQATGLTPRIAASLQAALTPGWVAERIIEPLGEVAIVVLPADDDPALPSFLLYETATAARVAVILADRWEAEQEHAGRDDAVTALVALAAAARTATAGHGAKPARTLAAA